MAVLLRGERWKQGTGRCLAVRGWRNPSSLSESLGLDITCSWGPSSLEEQLTWQMCVTCLLTCVFCTNCQGIWALCNVLQQSRALNINISVEPPQMGLIPLLGMPQACHRGRKASRALPRPQQPSQTGPSAIPREEHLRARDSVSGSVGLLFPAAILRPPSCPKRIALVKREPGHSPECSREEEQLQCPCSVPGSGALNTAWGRPWQDGT